MRTTTPIAAEDKRDCDSSCRACENCAAEHKIGEITSRQRFLNAARCEPVDRPPVWLMRQAGRCLPEYRTLKEKYTFLQLAQTPDLAAEVTLQPVRRFGFDAAILFSDILVVPEALGQKYRFCDKGGVEMEYKLDSATAIDQLEVDAIEDRLQYVAQALPLIKRELDGKTALLGFAGSPWTLANYMLEGGSTKEFTKAKALLYSNPALFEKLMEKLSDAVAAFLQLQIDSGVDAIQIFDSSGGILADTAFWHGSGVWMQRIIASLGHQVPVIVFSRGTHGNWDDLVRTGANILSVDWTMSLHEVWGLLPTNVGMQGNLDPFFLNTTPHLVAQETNRILTEMHGSAGYIFNLGHGVPPTARLENIQALVDTVRNFQ